MKGIACGMPRSATKSTAVLMRELGFPGYHQSMDAVGHEKNFKPYDLSTSMEKWAPWMNKKLEKIDRLSDDEGNYFEGNWSLSYVICPLNHYLNDVTFLIMVRDVVGNSNSLRHYRLKDASRRGNWVGLNPQYPVDELASYWIRAYSFICDQLEYCNPRAYLLHFDKYTKGYYKDFFFDYFKIPRTKENLLKADKVFSTKVNTRGDYHTHHVSKNLIEEANKVVKRLENLCLPIQSVGMPSS